MESNKLKEIDIKNFAWYFCDIIKIEDFDWQYFNRWRIKQACFG